MIGSELKKMRINAGYTSHESFAYDNELSRRHYWAAEKGKPIGITYLLRVLNIHKISINDFFCTMNAT